MNDNQFSRRYFFYGSLLAGAVPAGGFGSTPSLPALGYKSLNERLNIAAIGLGIRGPEILRQAAMTEDVVALCDVDDNHLAAAAKLYEKAKKYKDYRKLLESEGHNIDAVMIAVPDHQHAPVALMVMQHGKHVYCEKPLTRTPWEVRQLADAAAKYKVATQMGNQGFSHEGTRTACEILWSGDIGDVKELHAWTGTSQPNIPASGPPSEPVPEGLDWDMWLGPAEKRGFNPLMFRDWRSFIDFGTGGSLGDWLVHDVGPAHLALQLDKAAPTSVECVTVEGTNKWVWPLRSHVVYDFPARANMPPVKLNLYQNMRGEFQNPPGMAENEPLLPPFNNLADKNRPFLAVGDGTMMIGSDLGPDGRRAQRPAAPAPAAPAAARGGAAAGRAGATGATGAGRGAGRSGQNPAQRMPGNGAVFVGAKGYMATNSRGEGCWLLPASRWAEYRLPPQVLQRGINHQQDWIRSCKGGAPGVSQFSVATKYIEWLILGVIALRVPGKLLWDAKNMRFTNNQEANKYLRPYMRKGWEFKV
jgi:hypothetical protein